MEEKDTTCFTIPSLAAGGIGKSLAGVFGKGGGISRIGKWPLVGMTATGEYITHLKAKDAFIS